MNELEKKFLEYLKELDNQYPFPLTAQVHDLAEIAEKELPIIKEKIIEVLNKYKIEQAINDNYGGYFYDEVKPEQIASEILGDKAVIEDE